MESKLKVWENIAIIKKHKIKTEKMKKENREDLDDMKNEKMFGLPTFL